MAYNSTYTGAEVDAAVAKVKARSGDLVDGSGNATKVAKFSGTNTITDSIITDSGSTVTIAGHLDVSDNNITNVGSIALDTITNDGTDVTIDSSGDIILDADGAQVRIKDAGTERFIFNTGAAAELDVIGTSATIHSNTSDADIIFKGNDGGSSIDALTLDMSEAGAATFNSTVTATSYSGALANGVTATTQSADDNSTKVATTAYVDAAVTAEDLDFAGDSGTGAVDLDSQSLTIAGTANEVATSASGQTLTIGLPSTINVDVNGDLTGDVTGNVTGNLDGNISRSTSASVSATEITLNASGDIVLDAGGADIRLKDDGTQFGRFANSSSNLVVASSISDEDILFQGSDGGATITALTLDMSEAGAATFNDKITAVGTSSFVNINASGNVDIDGTANLDAVDIDGNVQVDGTVTVGVDDTGHDVKFYGATTGNYMLWDESENNLILGGTDAKLGIGTTSAPAGELHVHSYNTHADIHLSSEVTADSIIALQTNTQGSAREARIGYDYSASVLKLVTGATFAGSTSGINIDTDGKVGIGTAAPSYILDINDDASTGTGLRVTGGGSGQPLATFTRDVGSTGEVMINASGGDPQIRFTSASDNWSIGLDGTVFNISDGTAVGADQRLVIDSAGQIGIGTTSPSHKLHLAEASTDFAALISNSTASGNGLKINAGDNSGDRILQLSDKDGNEKLRVGATGLVGIGNASPSSTLDVTGTLAVSGNVDFNGDLDVDGTSNLDVVDIDGAVDMASTLNVAGDMGIGTTSPAEKLEVVGNGMLDATDANLKIKAGTGDSTGAVYFTYNTVDNLTYGSLRLNWANRNSDGLMLKSIYPISIDAGSGIEFREDGTKVAEFTDTGHFYHNLSSAATGAFPGLVNDTHGFMSEEQGANGNTLHVSRKGSNAANFARNTNDGTLIGFYSTAAGGSSAASLAGTIEIDSATTVSIQSASDYRLKENIVPVTDGIDRLKQMPVYKFNFTHDADRVVDGFLAHEVQPHVPEAVKGDKDEMQEEEYEISPAVYEDVVVQPAAEAVYEDVVHPATYEEVLHPAVDATYDEDGNELTPAQDEWIEQVLLTEEYTEQVLVTEAQEEWTEKTLVSEAVMGTRAVPKYQTMDQSKIVPLLTAALQEAVAKIESLEARIATLEG